MSIRGLIAAWTAKESSSSGTFSFALLSSACIRAVLLRRDDSALGHCGFVGDALVQNRRERIRQTGFAVFHGAACSNRILLSRASFGSALDGPRKIKSKHPLPLAVATGSPQDESVRVRNCGRLNE